MVLVNKYGTPNNIEVALRFKEFLGNDHGLLKYWGVINKDERINGISLDEVRERIRMNVINHYRTPNLEILHDRCEEYLKHAGGRGAKNYNINKIKFFKDIPDGIEILIDYVDVTALRAMQIPMEIIYESIYRKLPELFEE